MSLTTATCRTCHREHEVPAALSGQRLECECGGFYRVSDEQLDRSMSRDLERKVVALRKKVASLRTQIGVGFPFFGVCVLALAASLSSTYGMSKAAIGAFVLGGWFLVTGGIFQLTGHVAMAKLAAVGWFVIALPVGFLTFGLLLGGFPIVGLVAAVVLSIVISVLPAKVVKEFEAQALHLLAAEEGVAS